jgi:hypothetical protein
VWKLLGYRFVQPGMKECTFKVQGFSTEPSTGSSCCIIVKGFCAATDL